MNYGEIIDTASAKERFMGNYKLFSRFLFQFPDRSLYVELREALDGRDVKKAFEVAHTMKGLVGNLSLKKMEKPLWPMVETLRAGDLPDADAQQALQEAYTLTLDAIRQLKEEGAALF